MRSDFSFSAYDHDSVLNSYRFCLFLAGPFAKVQHPIVWDGSYKTNLQRTSSLRASATHFSKDSFSRLRLFTCTPSPGSPVPMLGANGPQVDQKEQNLPPCNRCLRLPDSH